MSNISRTQFATQSQYDKFHLKLKELKQKFFDNKIEINEVKNTLFSYRYSNWGAERVLQIWIKEKNNRFKSNKKGSKK